MRKSFKKLIAMVLSLAMLASFCLVPMSASAAEDTRLKFDSEGKFKIVIFSDVQDQYPVHQRVIRIMEQAIERENPDLVVFTGDMTEINTKDVEVDYKRTVEQILGPVVDAGIPYSIVFGNHDPQSYYSGQVTSKDAMLAVWQSIGDCRTVDANPELSGTGTCKIPVYSSNGSAVAFNLWMLDSGSYQNPLDGSSGYGSVQDDQLAWMAANNDAGVNSIAFQHIPMPEMYNLFVEDANGTKTYNGKTYKLELIDGVTGKAGEFPAPCPADKSNEYAALKEMGNVLGVVTGHDHLNDFSGKFENDGLTMTAVPGMTYFNYGDEAVRGYGVIELDEADLSSYDYHSVKFSTLDEEAGGTTETVYDEYDVINYSDLKQNGNAVGESYTISGGHNFTYDATSPSYSAKFRFRWTAGSTPAFQVSFDGAEDGNITFPFGLWIKKPNDNGAGANGAWHLKPSAGTSTLVNMTSAVKAGDTFDIEIGRLKVLSGDPKYVGMYYFYLKVNGTIIQQTYTNTTEDGKYTSNGIDCELNNVIRFGGWGNGGDDVISEYVEPAEQYAAYDVIGYEDLLDTGNNPLTPGGIQLTKTNNSVSYVESEEAAKTHSVIFKLRWTMETKDYFQIHMQSWGGANNFAYIMDGANFKDRATGAAVPVSPRATAGDYYDFEVGRLMVVSGVNAGKYYSYFKVDGEIIFEKYVSADDENTTKYLGNKIYIGFEDNYTCKISATPYDLDPDSPYYPYDEVTYYDLLVNGNKISGDTFNVNSQTFTYDRTSDTGSIILKYRWKEANAGSSFQLSFDRADKVAYMFGMQFYQPGNNGFTNASIRLRPGLNDSKAWVELKENLESGKDYDIEFARLKVRNGEHKGDWHVYVKINDVLVAEDYVDGSLISKQGNYTTNPDSYAANVLSNTIYLTFWGNGGGNKIAPSPYVEEYDAYDEIGFNDLYLENVGSMDGQIIEGGDRKYTYDATSRSYSVKFQYRWIPGGEKPGFTSYLDDWVFPFCFCAKYPGRSDFGAAAGENGAWHLVPSNNGHIVQMKEPVVAGKAYDIEMGRLKVKNGENKGKYYVYVNVNGELIKGYYYDGVVDGVYGDGTKLSNKIIIASQDGNKFCDVSMPVEEPDAPEEPEAPDALYYAYDEITYSDLLLDGSPLDSETQMGTKTFTYNKTSATGSVVLKYRWKAVEGSKFQLSFDTCNNAVNNMFGVQLYAPGSEAEGGYAKSSIRLRPGKDDKNAWVELASNIEGGKDYDIEFARLKVKNGDHAGEYYVYFKLNDVKIAESYVAADVVDANGNYAQGGTTCTISNQVYLTFWGADGNKITYIPVPEIYEAYDDLSFDDLWINENSMAGREMDGSHNYTYNATSPTYSMKLKFRWTAGGDTLKFSTFLDEWVYPFCFAAKTPNQSDWGAAAGPNGAWHLVPSNADLIVQMDQPIVAGQAYDIEIGRLKVASGANAGKYYVYFMVNGEMIVSYYYDGVVNGTYKGTVNGVVTDIPLSNKIIFSAPAGNTFKATPFVEEYEDYDEIGFEDLKDAEGNSLSGQKQMSGATLFNYDSTSATGSVIFKYRWKIGSVAKFQMSFENTSMKPNEEAMAYMFGAWMYAPSEVAAEGYPNGRVWLRPSYGPQAQLAEALGSGTSHNVEFGRLMVANGSNKGKYYVYFKIDDVLIAESYVDANVVDADGNYVTGPGDATCNVKSGEIFMAFWGTEGNVITSYKVPGSTVHEGTKGDFDGDGFIAAEDLVTLRKIILGLVSTIEMPAGIADFNLDGKVDVRDLVAMKKYMAPVNSYEKTGSLALGLQEHLLEDETKTPTYIADVTATMGASTFRLSRPIHTLYYATANNGVAVKEENMANFRAMVEALKAKGIKEILYVTDAFILPYGYADAAMNHNKTVPDPVSDYENYIAWLNVNAAAFKALAEEFPEIKYFEPYNEMNVSKGSGLERYGIAWDAEENDAYKYTMEERAGITADLCWYISKAVKSVDRANQVTTPSLSVDNNHSHVEGDFLDALYDAIESGNYPRYNDVADTRIDNYFTIINIHAYVEYTEADKWYEDFNTKADEKVNAWADRITYAYNIAKAHNDGGSRVWLTETGMSTYHPDGEPRDEDNVAAIITKSLNKLDTALTFVDTVIFYEIADKSTNAGASAVETNYGLFYAGDDGWTPYAAKPSAKAVYNFFNGGTNDYSALDALTNRYAQ